MTDEKNAPEVESVDSRQKLIETAAKLFAAKGFDGVSTRDIAGDAAVNISLISYYFNGKEGLYMAVLEDFSSRAHAKLTHLFEGFSPDAMTKESFVRQMTLVIHGIVTTKYENPYYTQLMFREVLSGLPHACEIVSELMQTMAATIINLFEVAQKKGFVRSDIHAGTHFMTLIHASDTYYIVSLCKSSPAQRHILKLPEQKKEYINQLVKVFIEGVLR